MKPLPKKPSARPQPRRGQRSSGRLQQQQQQSVRNSPEQQPDRQPDNENPHQAGPSQSTNASLASVQPRSSNDGGRGRRRSGRPVRNFPQQPDRQPDNPDEQRAVGDDDQSMAATQPTDEVLGAAAVQLPGGNGGPMVAAAPIRRVPHKLCLVFEQAVYDYKSIIDNRLKRIQFMKEVHACFLPNIEAENRVRREAVTAVCVMDAVQLLHLERFDQLADAIVNWLRAIPGRGSAKQKLSEMRRATECHLGFFVALRCHASELLRDLTGFTEQQSRMLRSAAMAKDQTQQMAGRTDIAEATDAADAAAAAGATERDRMGRKRSRGRRFTAVAPPQQLTPPDSPTAAIAGMDEAPFEADDFTRNLARPQDITLVDVEPVRPSEIEEALAFDNLDTVIEDDGFGKLLDGDTQAGRSGLTEKTPSDSAMRIPPPATLRRSTEPPPPRPLLDSSDRPQRTGAVHVEQHRQEEDDQQQAMDTLPPDHADDLEQQSMHTVDQPPTADAQGDVYELFPPSPPGEQQQQQEQVYEDGVGVEPEPDADSFELAPLDARVGADRGRRGRGRGRRRGRGRGIDPVTKLTDANMQHRTTDRRNILRSLQEDRLPLLRITGGWRSADDLLAPGDGQVHRNRELEDFGRQLVTGPHRSATRGRPSRGEWADLGRDQPQRPRTPTPPLAPPDYLHDDTMGGLQALPAVPSPIVDRHLAVHGQEEDHTASVLPPGGGQTTLEVLQQSERTLGYDVTPMAASGAISGVASPTPSAMTTALGAPPTAHDHQLYSPTAYDEPSPLRPPGPPPTGPMSPPAHDGDADETLTGEPSIDNSERIFIEAIRRYNKRFDLGNGQLVSYVPFRRIARTGVLRDRRQLRSLFVDLQLLVARGTLHVVVHRNENDPLTPGEVFVLFNERWARAARRTQRVQESSADRGQLAL